MARLALTLSLIILGCSGTPAGSEAVVEPKPDLGDLVAKGSVTTTTSPRPTFAGLVVRMLDDRAYVLEGVRDEAGSSKRRLSVYEANSVVFRFETPDFIHSFTVHPSGDVTLAVEREHYELVRLSRDGDVRSRAPLPQPPSFLMKAWPLEAISDGWVRLEARGDDVVVAYLSLVDNGAFATGVASLAWANGYSERWSRVVEGRHRATPAGWAYDEFRWMDAAIRPLLAVSDDGTVIVGRAWNKTRCAAVAAEFGEFTQEQCRTEVSAVENERSPFAFTTFAADGTRLGTRRFLPRGMAEFVVFDLAAHGDTIAIAGSAARSGPDPDYPLRYEGTYVAYDGYVALLDRATGAIRREHVLDEGRGDFLSSVRFTDKGLLAAGGAGWDRWYGGMSISRGAAPWIVFLGNDGSMHKRTLGGSADRHTHFFSIDTTASAITAVGLFDAPMTHSGAMTFGGLRVGLTGT